MHLRNGIHTRKHCTYFLAVKPSSTRGCIQTSFMLKLAIYSLMVSLVGLFCTFSGAYFCLVFFPCMHAYVCVLSFAFSAYCFTRTHYERLDTALNYKWIFIPRSAQCEGLQRHHFLPSAPYIATLRLSLG